MNLVAEISKLYTDQPPFRIDNTAEVWIGKKPAGRWVLVHMVEEYARHKGTLTSSGSESTASSASEPRPSQPLVRRTLSPLLEDSGLDRPVGDHGVGGVVRHQASDPWLLCEDNG